MMNNVTNIFRCGETIHFNHLPSSLKDRKTPKKRPYTRKIDHYFNNLF